MKEQLSQALVAAGIDLRNADSALDAMQRYWEHLLQVNEHMNLTAITDTQAAIQLHFVDSLAPLAFELLPHGARVVDLGSGAGFPGIPLAIARPDLHITLVDSLGKRVNFLNEVIAMLNLNAVAVHRRAEELPQPERETYDIALARAVARLNTLAEWAFPFIKRGGALIAYKGPSAAEELAQAQTALKRLGGAPGRIQPTPIQNHTLIIIPKLAPTPKSIPRQPGEALRNPL